MNVLHNSKLAQFRSKLGALRTGDHTQIRIFAEYVYRVKIKLDMDESSEIHEMQQNANIWTYDFIAPQAPCIVWYSFIVESDYKAAFYGPHRDQTQGDGELYSENERRFQLTVYDRNFKTPDWAKEATMYQIFPDRFCRGNQKNLIKGANYHRSMGRTVVLHEKWDELPLYTPLEGERFYAPCDYFGGDLQGIEKQLDYIESLGVTLLYLNPIVEAASNHRYNTADYMQVDPILGSNYDFSHLCDAAKVRGIRIILDGVFSHTGSDSRYFNKKENYEEKGAYQGEESPYYGWYSFNGSRDDYKSWWAFDTLPEVVEENPSWQKYVITSKNSVFYNWLNMGANGFRLDVADELPDEVIATMRDTLKREDDENLLIGEVWEDATTKHSYGKNRHYALGNGLDSVMNYPFRLNCIQFFLEKIDAYQLAEFLTAQQLNYPIQMYYTLMNLLSSHDVPRIKTMLATGINGDGILREQQAKLTLTPQQEETGTLMHKLSAVLQFVIPGMPCIYYGDEQGLEGLKDPFNRGTFRLQDKLLADFFREISNLRKQEDTLKTGHTGFLALGRDVIAVLRFIVNNEDCFGKQCENEAILTLINRGEGHSVSLPLENFIEGIHAKELKALKTAGFSSAVNLLESDRPVSFSGSCVKVTLPKQGFVMLKLK